MVVDVVGDVNGDGDGDGDGQTATILRNEERRAADGTGMLSFQKLDVYRCAIEFLARSTKLPQSLPKGHATLADQLRRAATSVPLNIAEAAGRTSELDAARHYAIARGSAMECAAILDALHVLAIVDEREHKEAGELLARIVAMLTKLCR